MIRQHLIEYSTAARLRQRISKASIALAAIQLLLGPAAAWAQDTSADPPASEKAHLDIAGFAMLDSGYDFKQNDPDWFDTMRPSKLPAFKDEFGKDGNFYAGVRQSRLGFNGFVPTPLGELKTIFEFELFGTGVDAGQTTFRLRHAWGQLGRFGAGQYWSTFVDVDVFPNQLEYWGPSGIVWYRNVQFRFTAWSNGDSNLMFAAERPGATADGGSYADTIEIQGVKPRNPMPDITGHFRWSGKAGHIQVGGLYRRIQWDDLNATPTSDLSGHANGWGTTVSSNVKLSKHVLHLEAVYGSGVENYMNDAPADVGVQNNFSNTRTPIVGKALPALGLTAFLDLNWSKKFTSTIGYSRVDIDTTDGQAPTSFKSGQYALTNILYYPIKNVMFGPEFQWGYRGNKDGSHMPDYRVQFSARYNFAFRVGG